MVAVVVAAVAGGEQETWAAQAEVAKSKEMLEEALQSYQSKGKALLLLRDGTQPARVGGVG